MAENWINDLERDLKNVLKKDNKTSQGKIYMEKNNSQQYLLFTVILVLAVGSYFAFKMKSNVPVQNNWQQNNPWQQQQQFSNNTNNVNPWQQQQFSSQTLDQKVDILKKQYETIDIAAQKIWERTKWNSDRMSLLATLNNHNLVIIQNNLPRNELIFLNPDWTINRYPDRIKLDPTDQEFLKKFIRPAATKNEQ